MLLNLSAKNFILIDQLNLDFSGGMHVITGETGAGKSILLDAMLFCLGHKFDVDVIKFGSESCIVSLEAEISESVKVCLDENSIEYDETVIITRQQTASGKRKFFINDRQVTQKLLEQIAAHLLEIHGQNTHSSLLDINSHLKIIDSYGELDLLRDDVAFKFRNWQTLKRELEEIEKHRAAIDQEIDYLEFIVNELERMSISLNEEEELSILRTKLQTQDRDKKTVQDIIENLTDPDIQLLISQVQKIIYKQVKDDSFADILANLEQASVYIAEALSDLEDKRTSEYEEENLESVEERLFAIRSLARKHNVAASALPDFLNESKIKLQSLCSKVEGQSNLEQNIIKSENDYKMQAAELSTKRKQSAADLEQRVAQELIPLKMPASILKVEFTGGSISDASSTGIDKVRFVASNNPGTPLAPIDKIASGGELSRFMLAMKVALFDKFIKPTIIFDEIDTGIGGVVADAVGARMKDLSRVAQVITITHQPQVAGKADVHILVSKIQNKNDTLSGAKVLSEHERLEEIARMISGQEITDNSRQAARELLK